MTLLLVNFTHDFQQIGFMNLANTKQNMICMLQQKITCCRLLYTGCRCDMGANEVETEVEHVRGMGVRWEDRGTEVPQSDFSAEDNCI